MASNLEREFQWYLSNQENLVEKYNGRVLVIRGEDVVGDYSSEAEAFLAAKSRYAVGTFLVQKCSPGAGDYTQTFQSRVAFG